MKTRMYRYVAPALLAAAIPAGLALAQTQPQPKPPAPPQAEPQHKRERPHLSEDARKRLRDGRQEGRITQMKESLKLNDAQLQLWAPVEQQVRASHAARQKARADRRERRQAGATPPPLPERLDLASQRMTERAQHMQAFATAFRPFYESLSEEQKAVAGIVLGDLRDGMRGHLRGMGRRWAMEHFHHRRGVPGHDERQPQR